MSKAPSNAKPRRGRSKSKPISRGPYGLSVVEAGKMIGLGRNAAYEAVKNKQIPVLQIGKRKIVPRGPWLKHIGAEENV